MKFFVNKPNLAFDDVADCEPAQSLLLSEADYQKPFVPLKFVKFQAVSTLSVRI